MRYSLKITLVVISGFFLPGCVQSNIKPASLRAPRISKTVPLIYKNRYDSLFRFSNDTVYYANEFYSGFLVDVDKYGDSLFNGSFFNGVEEGRHTKWHSNGTMSEERYYINGKKEGLQRGWWPSGKPKFRFSCYNGELEGVFEEWSESGLLIKQFNYRDGYEYGPQKLWWDNGNVRANYVVKNGRKYGLIGLKLCSNPYDSAIIKK